MIRYKETLKNKKNLLAFSGGTDSSALFHILLKENIPFDIAFVNYNTREESKLEQQMAENLAKEYNKKLYMLSIRLSGDSNFEKRARDIRHTFFEDIIHEEKYDNLITGHNLNDKTEWFLMQFTRGAGSMELFGMDPVTNKETYKIIRPLIHVAKNDILLYLEAFNIPYSYDLSNDNKNFTRNKFRHEYVSKLVKEYSEGIRRTFDILEKEVETKKPKIIFRNEETIILEYKEDFVKATDIGLKIFGYVMSKAQREEMEENEEIVVKVDDKSMVASIFKNKVIITPYIKRKMDKDTKNKMRNLNIPVKTRQYLFDKADILKILIKD